MTVMISAVISLLEKRKAALGKAQEALAEIDGATTEPSWRREYRASTETSGVRLFDTTEPASTRKGKKRSAGTRNKMREAQRKRRERIRARS